MSQSPFLHVLHKMMASCMGACLFILLGSQGLAQSISGKVTDPFGAPLPYASVYLKGNTKGTVANSEGKYFLDLTPGQYQLVCAYVGYQKVEKLITVGNTAVVIDFALPFQQTELKEVTIKANAEDPAYAIIRNAIKKRKAYLNEVKEWEVMVYMKGLIRTYKLPRRIMGIDVNANNDVVDSTGRGIIYFSESLTRYSKKLPDKVYEDVISAKVAGNSSGFGFNSPQDLDINLYENNISIEGLNSRGFMSPIGENALYFYDYKYEGSFYEDGQEVNRIRVIPKRKYEPLFAGGFIEIMEGNWRIHGVDLYLTKESQIEVVDSLRLRQQMFPVDLIWLPQKTEIIATFGAFGIKAGANFIAVYSDYNLERDLTALMKSKVVKRIDTAANKRSVAYWEKIRPMPLTDEERKDYLKKDTLEQKFRDPHYLDSLDKIANKFNPMQFFIAGSSYVNTREKKAFSLPGLLPGVQYNTVEGWVYQITPSYRKWTDTGAFSVTIPLRYGFGNKHLSASAIINTTIGKNYRKRWGLTVAGGKNVFQINPADPIQPLNSTIGTLLFTVNHLKIYEKAYAQVFARRTLNNGLRLGFGMSWEDRRPMENGDTSYRWRTYKNRSFTSNYPPELPPGYFERHQAFITNFEMRWQPGLSFVEYPNRRYVQESEKPVFRLNLTKAWGEFLGSDAKFWKWRISVNDEIRMKLAGSLIYFVETGGFFNSDNVQLPDWRHFMGNQTVLASPYTRSFQLAPYYANSTRDNHYVAGHMEWHFNGLLTNKIPFFRRLNWNLVTGSNGFFVDEDRNYFEIFFGLENIFKFIRVDWVAGYDGFNQLVRNKIIFGFNGLFAGQTMD